jgi:ATP-binding cassette subfamily B multidrug efflux pump
VGGRLTILNTISAGDFVAFNSYLLLLTWPMMALGWMINLFQRGAASLGRIQRILDTAQQVVDSPGTEKNGLVRGLIECRGLTLVYPGSSSPALLDIRLRIEPGQFVGIVGRTGAGKSSLLRIIPRLYELSDGQLYLDGKELHRWPLVVLRGAIAMVPQEPFIFADTVRANLCFGRPGAGDDEMMRAAREAQLLDEILALPRQFDTLLGERGISLSGGQKQRLTLARALMLERPVLILDDCLSSVDMETEVAILANLKHYLRERTTIMASQRLEAIRNADVIFVLDDGRLKESGRHEELLALNGVYSSLYRRQQLEEELKAKGKAL